MRLNIRKIDSRGGAETRGIKTSAPLRENHPLKTAKNPLGPLIQL